MKKILVLALAIVMAFSVVALVACDQGETYEGKCYYEGEHGSYGCKVTVTVKGDVITNVKLWTDEEAGEGYKRTSQNWGKGEGQMQYNETDLGYTAAEAAYPQWLKDTFEGKTVAQVKAYVASADANGQTVGTESVKLAGATQSAARIIVAVQNALSKIPAAK